jgi:hypothetical protein
MRLFDLFARSRPQYAPRPRSNQVRCTVELLEARLVLSSTDLISTASPTVPQPAPTSTTTQVAPAPATPMIVLSITTA